MVKQNTWENNCNQELGLPWLLGTGSHSLTWGCCCEQDQADPELRLLLSPGTTEPCSVKPQQVKPRQQLALNSITTRARPECAHLQKELGGCGGWLAAHIWSFSRGRTGGFSTHRALKDGATTNKSEMGTRIYMLVFRLHEFAKEKKSKLKKTDDVMKMTTNRMKNECFISELSDN